MWCVTCVCMLLSAFQGLASPAGYASRSLTTTTSGATEDNRIVVLTIKGTSIPIVDGGPTIENDKLNDNLLFSCCCAHVSRTWTPVCDCYRGGGNVTNNASKML